MKHVDPNKYQQDLAECRQYADQVDVAGDTATDALVGAGIGAAGGAVLGAITGSAGAGAAIGAGVGGIGGGAGVVEIPANVRRTSLTTASKAAVTKFFG